MKHFGLVLLVIVLVGCAPEAAVLEFEETAIDNQGFDVFLVASPLTAIGSDLVYKARAQNQGERSFQEIIVYQDQIAAQHEKTSDPMEIDGKLAYVAYDGEESFINYNGERYGVEEKNVRNPFFFKDKLGFVATISEDKEVIVHDGEEIGSEHGSAANPIEINGKLAYRALGTAGMTNTSFIVFDGQVYGEQYHSVEPPFTIDGKLAYIGYTQEDFTKVLVWNGQEIGAEYDDISSLNKGNPFSFNGKLIFTATKDRKSVIVVDGEELGTEYLAASHPTDINGNLAYIAINQTEQFIVYKDQKIGLEYGRVFSLTEVDGKLVFLARKGTQNYIIREV